MDNYKNFFGCLHEAAEKRRQDILDKFSNDYMNSIIKEISIKRSADADFDKIKVNLGEVPNHLPPLSSIENVMRASIPKGVNLYLDIGHRVVCDDTNRKASFMAIGSAKPKCVDIEEVFAILNW